MNVSPADIRALRDARRLWAGVPVAHRLRRVRMLRGLISREAEALANASAAARGRPMAEALTAEVIPLAEACRFLERHAGRLLKTRCHGRRGRPLWLGGVRSEVHRDGIGVILIIGPGNYPLFLPGVQLIQALVAGNAVIFKPGAGGTAAATALIDLIHRAGFDPRLIRLLPESVEAAVSAMDAGPDKVIFTGSATNAGKILARLADRLIPAVIEASGCDAVIVRADADPVLAAKALVFSLSLNAGATCMAPKRLFIHRDLAADLRKHLAAALAVTESFPVLLAGHHRDQLDEALRAGAVRSGDGPILLENVAPDSPLWQEDLFGAVVLVATFATDDEAVARTNQCPFALGASVFSADVPRARQIAEQLDVGLVTINDLIVPSADARLPFGGRRRSGYGTTRGAEGLLEMTALKAVTISRARFRPAYEPVTPRFLCWILSYVRTSHAIGWSRKLRNLPASNPP